MTKMPADNNDAAKVMIRALHKNIDEDHGVSGKLAIISLMDEGYTDGIQRYVDVYAYCEDNGLFEHTLDDRYALSAKGLALLGD